MTNWPERGIAVVAVALAGCGDPSPEPPAGGLRLAEVLGGNAPEDFRSADRVLPFSFPADHGSHPEYRSEWWYLTVALRAPGGEEYGVQFTLFRQGLRRGGVEGGGEWRTGQIYMGHLALTDVSRVRHVEAERVARGHPRLAGVQTAPFAAWIEGWHLASEGAAFLPLRLQATTDDFAVDLVFDDARPPALQGDRGLSAKGPHNASYYYSIPRIGATGTVRSEDQTITVSGRGWLDHEWSTSVLADEYAGWDWFALHLDDGRDAMVFQLRRRDGLADDYDQGLLADAHGQRHLAAGDFALTVERRWRDGRGVAWPVQWRLQLDGDTLIVDAAIEDQVMDTSIRYWEGLVQARAPDGRPLGRGYMELTGYR